MDDLPKLMEEVIFSIKKNIESNSEQSEDSILNRFSQLERLVCQALGIEPPINEEEDDGEEDESLSKSIADKFNIPEIKSISNTSEVLNNMESNILDTNCRLENLETSIGHLQLKINDLIKVNNAILKRLETTNSNFVPSTTSSTSSSTTTTPIQNKPSLTIGKQKRPMV